MGVPNSNFSPLNQHGGSWTHVDLGRKGLERRDSQHPTRNQTKYYPFDWNSQTRLWLEIHANAVENRIQKKKKKTDHRKTCVILKREPKALIAGASFPVSVTVSVSISSETSSTMVERGGERSPSGCRVLEEGERVLKLNSLFAVWSFCPSRKAICCNLQVAGLILLLDCQKWETCVACVETYYFKCPTVCFFFKKMSTGWVVGNWNSHMWDRLTTISV